MANIKSSAVTKKTENTKKRVPEKTSIKQKTGTKSSSVKANGGRIKKSIPNNKKNTNKSNTAAKKTTSAEDFRRQNVTALFMVIAGMVTTLSITTNAMGFIGKGIKAIMLGQFAKLSIIIALTLLIIGAIRLVYSSKFSLHSISPVMIILVSVATIIFYGALNLETIFGGKFSFETIRIIFISSIAGDGIGIWPHITAYFLDKLIGKTGMFVISISIYLFVGIYYFKWSPSKLGDASIILAKKSNNIAKNMKDKALDYITEDKDSKDVKPKIKGPKKNFLKEPQAFEENKIAKKSNDRYDFLEKFYVDSESKELPKLPAKELQRDIKKEDSMLSHKDIFETENKTSETAGESQGVSVSACEITEDAIKDDDVLRFNIEENSKHHIKNIEKLKNLADTMEYSPLLIKSKTQSQKLQCAYTEVSDANDKASEIEKSEPTENISKENESITVNTENDEHVDIIDEREAFIKNQMEKEHPEDLELARSEGSADISEVKYILPSMLLLKDYKMKFKDPTKQQKNSVKLEETLQLFGIESKVVNVSVGPTITRYELQPKAGVKVSKILNLSDDLALALAAVAAIRIEAPIPGTSLIGIELPNAETDMVSFKSVLESQEFFEAESKLTFVLGKDVSGRPIVSDISKMPHMLVAGATGSGKSVCVNALICSILFKAKPDEVKFIMIDPKMVELSIYNDIPHLLIPVVTDMKKAPYALSWAVNEMNKRYKLFAENRVRDIKGYNELEDIEEKMPRIVIIVDELADLMMVSPNEVEEAICRLAQMARACGMHLVLATQRPSVDVITGLIKSNIPSRIAFAVSSQVDSRTILDSVGAEKLIGKGDMLYSPQGMSKAQRIQGAFITDKEVKNIVEFITKQSPKEKKEIRDIIEETIKLKNDEKKEKEVDPLIDEVIEFAQQNGQISTSLVQRRFRLGYNRASRIIDEMEDRGICGPMDGAKPRKIYAKQIEILE
ncbi:MAG: DNA translocase FtsK [Proteocatella sp.]